MSRLLLFDLLTTTTPSNYPCLSLKHALLHAQATDNVIKLVDSNIMNQVTVGPNSFITGDFAIFKLVCPVDEDWDGIVGGDSAAFFAAVCGQPGEMHDICVV
jgi:hypothetical protein